MEVIDSEQYQTKQFSKTEIVTEITRDDYVAFNKYAFVKRRLKRSIVLSLVVSLVLAFSLSRNSDSPFFEFVLTFFIYNLIFWGVIYYNINKTRKTPMKGGNFIGDRKYIISDDELICETNLTHSKVKWNGIKSVEVGKKAVYLFIDTNQAFVIPRRAFDDENSEQEFVNTINEKIRSALE